MSVGRILTLGLGSFGGVNYLPTLGYASGEAPPPSPSTDQPSGGYLRGSDRRRTQKEIDEARRRFGINVPEEVIEVIQEAAQDQVEDSVTDPQKQKRDLQMRLRVRQLKFEAEHLKALAIERERLIDEALREQAQRIHRNNQSLTLLLIAALH